MNAVSSILRDHGIEPYLWMEAKLKKLFRELKDKDYWTVDATPMADTPVAATSLM